MLGKCSNSKCRFESDLENWIDNWEVSSDELTLYATCPRCGEYIVITKEEWKGGD